MLYHFNVHDDSSGYWAECLELEGCSTQGDTIEELAASAREALNLYLEEPDDSAVIWPLPGDYRGDDVLEVPVEPELALSVALRHLRSVHGLTQGEVAGKLGMRNLFSYQRLERRSNPSLAMLRRLRAVFPELSVDQVLDV